MTDKTMTTTSNPISEATTVEELLARVQETEGVGIVAEISAVYQRTMSVYGPAAEVYGSAVRAGQAVHGFSTSANG